jgi:hypothetical protein
MIQSIWAAFAAAGVATATGAVDACATDSGAFEHAAITKALQSVATAGAEQCWKAFINRNHSSGWDV